MRTQSVCDKYLADILIIFLPKASNNSLFCYQKERKTL